ncbi:MAG: NADPH-dependent assimilatory sulfite reductase hemoprotein subunit [Verrucomicrobiales bacterium]|nr:NADPH-dependent assimilatory sulfite reductase hemoprotein subunit [Verrucomicrobiales bacterium]
MSATATSPAETKPLTKNELLKIAIPTLAGTIAATLADPAADSFSGDDEQFLKFHGIYQQDDRDVRKQGKVHIMMIRGRIPGGVLNARQWIAFDDLSSKYGNNTLRVTTRQSIQWHGVAKSGLGALMKGIHEVMLDTLAACGDVSRNVMSAPTPSGTPAREQVYEDARRVSEALLPKTKAYHSIWIDGVQLNLDSPENKEFVDPLYGRQYLPRKFKAAFIIPPVNDMDVFANCLGFVAIVENGQVVGYNLLVGGGMGRSHGNAATYPRLATELGFLPKDSVVDVARAVLTIHRDFGDRTDRKHARLKYVVQERGADFIRAEVEKRAGVKLESPRRYTLTTTNDTYGWQRALDGSWFVTLYVSMGRIKDAGEHRMKTALRRVAEQFPGVEFRLSANQNVLLANVADGDRAALTALLAEHGVRTERQAGVLHSAAIACPALPTCGLSLAESERYLPDLLTRIEGLCTEVGLAGQEIVIRMTGCPNGCARPYMAEIGFVGKAPGRYQLWLGGNENGTRLNRIWKDMVKDADILPELRPLLTRYAAERTPAERFGDWVARVLWTEQPGTPV